MTEVNLEDVAEILKLKHNIKLANWDSDRSFEMFTGSIYYHDKPRTYENSSTWIPISLFDMDKEKVADLLYHLYLGFGGESSNITFRYATGRKIRKKYPTEFFIGTEKNKI